MANDKRAQAKAECHEQAMTRFRVGNEDLTPVIQAARFGFEAGCEFATAEAQADGWVDVADRLPEKEGMYLVSQQALGDDDLAHIQQVDIALCNVQKLWFGLGGVRLDGITAWQPLPTPYQRKSEGDSNER